MQICKTLVGCGLLPMMFILTLLLRVIYYYNECRLLLLVLECLSKKNIKTKGNPTRLDQETGLKRNSW